ncbi:TonB-dependent receptor domain-containing protein [Capnocytophaga catalasegens]|uniref:TonB-dependent receptor n=1 Tax=Capnocytophaga catalasegens TaxID=1004260 RepID=A0AAV5AUF6_9FLAO|nr:TonB-dependent receptor [Capnocytophaga catalasegens]GIZ16120.1 TonB-dependent receptor [Capnocytophaga catalasegens]GJM50937.1 TonB-dependent receptor [Capnocytophaga catalasegens]GJM53781.1 TonB-dependent receptor [Capnocytophaga catalasegens]
MKKSTILLFIILFSIGIKAQNVKLTGKVIETSTKQPLEYATITLENINEIGKLTGGVTDTYGRFSLEAPKGTYLLKIQFFSYKTYQITRFVLNEDKSLGTISLDDDVAQLEGVEVVGKKSTVEMRLDKKIYNVGDDMTVKGGSITDVLDNVPSISVDSEGTISLRGSENVRVLINGKPSSLVGMSPETLKQFPSDMIEKVEVVTNPSARYDAEGTAGIINIVLKKGTGLGLTGSVNSFVGVADTENYGASINLNLREKKFNFFNTTSYRYNNAKGTTLFEQKSFKNAMIESYQDEYRDNWRLRRGWNTNLGIEYALSDKISITNSIMYGDNRNGANADVNIFNYNQNKNLVSNRLRQSNEKEKEYNIQYSFNYDQRFNNDGHKLTVDYQYSTEKEDAHEYIYDLQNEQSTNLEKQKDHLVKVDYVLPFSENSQFEAGYQGNFNNRDTDYQVFDEISGTLTLNTNYSNHFIYKEQINAFYSQYGKKFGKINTMLGLRFEDTHIIIQELQTGKNKKTYTGLFPSVFLGYEFSENNQVSISYTRRLQRPRNRFINPFTSRTGNTNLFRGNPDLDPTYTNAFDLGYLTRLGGKVTLNTSAYYNYSTQVFQFVTVESGEFVTIAGLNVPVMVRTAANLANQHRFGVEFTTTYSPKNNWRFTWNFNFFSEKTEGDFSYKNYLGNNVTQNLNASTTSWFTRLSAKMLLPLNIDFQSTAMYMGPRKTAQSDIRGDFFLNLALSKEIFNKKGTLSINASDVFNSRKMIADTQTPSVQTYSEMQWRPRQITMNFTYRFGNPTENRKKQRDKSQNRVGDDSADEMMF